MSPSPRAIFAGLPSDSKQNGQDQQIKIKIRNHGYRPWLLLISSVTFLFILFMMTFDIVSFALRHANALGRSCSPRQLQQQASNYVIPELISRPCRMSMAIVSLSNRPQENVWRNKKTYAKKMGYRFIDASSMIDRSRPPSWSKILAVKSALRDHHWVFWNDADTLVANPDIYLENILLSLIGNGDFNSTADLILTEDYNGVNAGVLFFRKSEWSQGFLETWWNQSSFVQFGSTKSGDNAALMHLIDHLPPQEFRDHVRISPMQCLFNSYPWFASRKSLYRLMLSPWTTWQGAYSDGDFMVHFAGIQNKDKWVSKMIQDMATPGRKTFFTLN